MESVFDMSMACIEAGFGFGRVTRFLIDLLKYAERTQPVGKRPCVVIYVQSTKLENQLLYKSLVSLDLLKTDKAETALVMGEFQKSARLCLVTCAEFLYVIETEVMAARRNQESSVLTDTIILMDVELSPTVDCEIAKALLAEYIRKKDCWKRGSGLKVFFVGYQSIGRSKEHFRVDTFGGGTPPVTNIISSDDPLRDWVLDSSQSLPLLVQGGRPSSEVLYAIGEALQTRSNVVSYLDSGLTQSIVNDAVRRLPVYLQRFCMITLDKSSKIKVDAGDGSMVDLDQLSRDVSYVVCIPHPGAFNTTLPIPDVKAVLSHGRVQQRHWDDRLNIVVDGSRLVSSTELQVPHAYMTSNASGARPDRRAMVYCSYTLESDDPARPNVGHCRHLEGDIMQYAFEVVRLWPGLKAADIPLELYPTTTYRPIWRVRETLNRLAIMGVIDELKVGFRLSKYQGGNLATMLPPCLVAGLDFHSAYVIACCSQDTSDRLNRILIRLGAIAGRVSLLLEPKAPEDFESTNVANLGGAVWEPYRRVAVQGTLWIALGVWETVRVSTADFTRADGPTIREVGDFKVNLNVARQIYNDVCGVERIWDFQHLAIDKPLHEQPLTDEELDQVQRHLMLAWLPNLVLYPMRGQHQPSLMAACKPIDLNARLCHLPTATRWLGPANSGPRFCVLVVITVQEQGRRHTARDITVVPQHTLLEIEDFVNAPVVQALFANPSDL